MAEDNKTVNPVKTEDPDAAKTEVTGSEKPMKKSFWTENKVEIVTAILLGMTALLTAWATWIGSLHGGIQAINFTKSNNTASEAGTAYDYELQSFISDVMAWNKIVDYSFEAAIAEADGNQKKADLIREKLQIWMKENDAESPFDMPGITDKYFEEAKGMFDEAHDLLKEGQNDNARGDAYNLVTVLFSIVLFLLGVVGIFKRLPNRVAILSIAVVILAGATIYMLTIPLPTGFNLFSFIGLK